MRWLKACGILAAISVVAVTASAQQPPYPPGPGMPPQAAPGQNPYCARLEGQLAAIDRGGDQTRAEQVRRYEDAAARQQSELDRMLEQSQRQGCERTGFFLFGGGQSSSQQCVDLNRQVSRMRSNLDRINVDLQRLRGSDVDRGEQRRSVMIALAQNNCGPQYRTAARQQGGFFDQLFGRSESEPNEPGAEMANPAAQSGSYRTVCVRTCDGYYFPISYATTPARFAQDERTCQKLCPAAEAQLFSYRTEGEDISQATSSNGAPYSSLPNAFKYRQSFDAACTCKKPGQSWSEALGGTDDSVEAGDIVVTEDRARQMALPPQQKGKGRTAAPAAGPATTPAAAAEAPAPAVTHGRKTIRSVGPTFIPAR